MILAYLDMFGEARVFPIFVSLAGDVQSAAAGVACGEPCTPGS